MAEATLRRGLLNLSKDSYRIKNSQTCANMSHSLTAVDHDAAPVRIGYRLKLRRAGLALSLSLSNSYR